MYTILLIRVNTTTGDFPWNTESYRAISIKSILIKAHKKKPGMVAPKHQNRPGPHKNHALIFRRFRFLVVSLYFQLYLISNRVAIADYVKIHDWLKSDFRQRLGFSWHMYGNEPTLRVFFIAPRREIAL